MVSDDFALEQFKKVYGPMFVKIQLVRGSTGGSEIVAHYDKPRFKRDWVPNTFCRRPVRCVRHATEQAATPTPMPA